ncbi:hypothetical protein DEE93_17310 [Ralstonia pickettii]|uniref:Uncharacterized protein n=2 Tax=Ralstonia pickettii TaxID=329 RepID=A0AAW4Q817_RALPI|nr:hypothetical protein [Ralstonia pickettii]MBA9852141.1 hypothetical protein [Ralstonia pickettii]MBA9919845.1 hypothetical protein [Ralstonia pickettii]MBA9958947.1 hypothetical protein [Ralstonia pickettii]MBA9964675.1 hypothetical protein [Ralstonia pickettii]
MQVGLSPSGLAPRRANDEHRSCRELVLGHEGPVPISAGRPLFLRSLGETGSGRSMAIMGLAEQMLAGGGAVLWIDSGNHPRVARALQKLADRYFVNYASSNEFSRGDQAAIANLMALGGIGHCVPEDDLRPEMPKDKYTRTRLGNILRTLGACELKGLGKVPPTLIVFNQIVGAFEGRAMGLSNLPAKLRIGGHSFVFSDTAVLNDALDVAAHVRQYLFHRMPYAHALRLVKALRPACKQAQAQVSAFFAPSGADADEVLAQQISQLVDEYVVYCANGDWTLLRSAAPSL